MSVVPLIVVNTADGCEEKDTDIDISVGQSPHFKTRMGTANGQYEDIQSSVSSSKTDVQANNEMALEDQLTNQKLKELEQIFEEADEDCGGGLDMDEFRNAMRQALGDHLTDEDLDRMFMKVDTNCDGTVDWDEYVSYMLLEYRERDAMNYVNQQKPLPQSMHMVKNINTYQRHHDSIVKIEKLPNSIKHHHNIYQPVYDKTGRYVTITKGGVVNFWSISLSHLKRHKLPPPPFSSNKIIGLWVTDMTVMPNLNLICVASTTGNLAFYDYNCYRITPIMTITKLEVCVSCVNYWMDPVINNHSILMWGDTRGNIMAIELNDCPTMCFFQHTLSKHFQSVMEFTELLKNTTCGVTAYKLPNVHQDTVIDIKYFPALNECFISCCRRNETAMFMGDFEAKKSSYFPVTKGINTFDYCSKTNIIVTGGKDALVRVWNPYVPSKPVMVLSGQKCPILYVFIHKENEHIISISQERDIIIFDMSTQTAIQTIRRKHVTMGPRMLSAVCFNESRLALILGSNQLALFEHHTEELDVKSSHSHDQPVSTVAYNSLFDQLVSGGTDSLVCVWNANSGERVMQFFVQKEEKEGTDMDVEITSMRFDPTLRRLITGGRDGSVKIWNFNNGALLRTLESETRGEVTGIVCPKQRILTTGWNRVISVYVDSYEDESMRVWEKRHKEDILALDYKAPSTVVSGSYDGDILIWTLETGHVTIRFNAHISAKPCSILQTVQPSFLKLPATYDDSDVMEENRDNSNLHTWMTYNTHRASIAAPIPFMMRRDSVAPRRNAFVNQRTARYNKTSKRLSIIPSSSNLLGIPSNAQLNINVNNNTSGCQMDKPTTQTVKLPPISQTPSKTTLAKRSNMEGDTPTKRGNEFKHVAVNETVATIKTDETQGDYLEEENTNSSNSILLPTRRQGNKPTASYSRKPRGHQPSTRELGSDIRKEYDTYVRKNEASIERLIMLHTRQSDKETATLIAVSAGAWVRFWSIDHNGGLLGQFNAGHNPGNSVQAACVDPSEKYLVTGDSLGYIKVWDISVYCTSNASGYMKTDYLEKCEEREQFPLMFSEQSKLREKQSHQSRHRPPPISTNPDSTWSPPTLLNSFRGHLHPIADITYIPKGNRIATCSMDCSIRVWTIFGEFIGICGQETPWSWSTNQANESTSCTSMTSVPTAPSINRTPSLRITKKSIFERWRKSKRALPPDVRRVASATTLRVLNGGIRPIWRLAKNIVMVWVPLLAMSRRRMHEEAETDDVNLHDIKLPTITAIDLSEPKPITSDLLGKTYKQTRKHKALPELPKIRQFHNQCDAYSSLPFFELTPIAEVQPPQAVLDNLERQREIQNVNMKARAHKGLRRLRLVNMFSNRRSSDDESTNSQQSPRQKRISREQNVSLSAT